MLKRMRHKGNTDRYTFGECCLFILIVMSMGLSILGMMVVFVLALAGDSFSPLVWLLPFCVVTVVSSAGLMYVLGGNGDYGGGGDDDEY